MFVVEVSRSIGNLAVDGLWFLTENNI